MIDERDLLASQRCECGCTLSEYKKMANPLKYQAEKQILNNFYQIVKFSSQLSREVIFIKIRNILGTNGYLKYSGRIDKTQLIHDFNNYLIQNGLKEYIAADLLSQIGSFSFFATKGPVKNILLYILMIMFLAKSVNNFLLDTTAYSIPIPFGNGPWICNNPICKGYNLEVIKKCVRVDHGGKYISGLFGCPLCGFSFSRRWKMEDLNNDKRYAVLTMGPLWYSTLLELHSSGLSYSEIAKKLNTSPTQINQYFKRLRKPSSDTRILQCLNMLWTSLDANIEVASTFEVSKLLSKNGKEYWIFLGEITV